MSVHVTSPMLRLHLKGEAKSVLNVFGDHANPSGENSFPSLVLVAQEAGYSLSTIKRYVKAYRADGVLVVEGEGGPGRRSVTYRIDLDRAKALYGEICAATQDLPFAVPGQVGPDQKKGHSDTLSDEKKRVTVTRKGVTVTPEEGHCDPLTVKEPPEPPAAAETPAPADPVEGSAGTGSDPPGKPTTWSQTTRSHWASKSAELAQHFDKRWAAWLRDRIVLKDDGSAMVLGAPSAFITTYCGRFVPDLERILERKVTVVEFDPKAEAALKRSQKAEQEAERSRSP